MSHTLLRLRYVLALSAALSFTCTAGGEEATVSVGGVIVDEADAPVEGVAVSLGYDDLKGRWQGVKATTDATGQWRADIPARLTTLTWQPQHPDFALSRVYSWLHVTDMLKAGTLRHTLRRGTTRSGIVTDAQGAPLPNVVVMRGWHNIHTMEKLREEVQSGTAHNAVITDEAGGFTIQIPEEERSASAFYLEDHGPEVRGMDDVETVALVPGKTWSGVVRDADGVILAATIPTQELETVTEEIMARMDAASPE